MLPALVEGYPVKWNIAFSQAVAASTVVDIAQGTFQLPEINVFTSFGVMIDAFTGGNITVKLRVGFNGFTLITGRGLDFINLGALNAQDVASVGFGIAAAAPAIAGNALFILPPVVQVFITTAAATLTYRVVYACVGVP